MKKILFFLFAFLAFQDTIAQSIFERKSIGNNVYVSTNTSEKKAESIRNFSLAFPEGLTVTDDDVSLILSTAQKKCKLQFPIEGIYKYKDWAIYDYVFYLTN